jgi:hypothetical protein
MLQDNITCFYLAEEVKPTRPKKGTKRQVHMELVGIYSSIIVVQSNSNMFLNTESMDLPFSNDRF